MTTSIRDIISTIITDSTPSTVIDGIYVSRDSDSASFSIFNPDTERWVDCTIVFGAFGTENIMMDCSESFISDCGEAETVSEWSVTLPVARSIMEYAESSIRSMEEFIA